MKRGFGNNKKTILLSVNLALILLFIADLDLVLDDPELINASMPFIELSGSVGTSIGNAKKAYIISNPAPSPTPIPSHSPSVVKPSDDNMIVDDDSQTAVKGEIDVRDERITIDGYKCTDVEQFTTLINSKKYQEINKYTIYENYANYQVFVLVLHNLDDAHKNYEIIVK